MTTVFGIKRDLLQTSNWWQSGYCWFRPFSSDTDATEFLDFVQKNGTHQERHGTDGCETDPSFQQVIPYGFFIDSIGKILIYTRGGSSYKENRLFGKISAGLGGHVDDSDKDVMTALVREISEEADLTQGLYIIEQAKDLSYRQWLAQYLDIKPLGILKDDRPDDQGSVGQVHLGLVCQLLPKMSDIQIQVKLGKEGVSQKLITLPDLNTMIESSQVKPETWTQLIIDLVLPTIKLQN